MKKFSLLAAVLIWIGIWVGVVTTAGASDWQGHKLADTPTNFIVGYGSLINSGSRNSTASAPIPAIPVRVSASFGYIRSWNDHSLSGFTALGLRKVKPGETGMTINAVLYPVEGTDMSKFDKREGLYTRVAVPASQIEAIGWQPLPAAGQFWIYVPMRFDALGKRGPPGEDLPEPDVDHPLLQSYIDLTVEGCLEYDTDFARELLDTTVGWSRYWLNDREGLARRPWIRDAKARDVDLLLATTPAPAAFFASRAFPEMYGEHFRPGAK
ncbi:MAG TPA: gamma-glutamylcyclotransferase family protein [Stellaceae bacterium]|nr:gamma-glutamylcyclotransferase family protein [Stellaceae bacterium]